MKFEKLVKLKKNTLERGGPLGRGIRKRGCIRKRGLSGKRRVLRKRVLLGGVIRKGC